MTDSRFYIGDGVARPQIVRDLPIVAPDALRKPEGYRATPELAAAVDVALTLGMPLLLTGEPGCGKSGLAASVAHAFGFELLHFAVKSDTESRDLFYRFDTVGRFHATQALDANDPDARAANFIAFEALGKAILLAKPPSIVEQLGLPGHVLAHPGAPQRVVVLIDEIDKAPRDVPNDILVEIENMQFDIPELSGGGKQVRVKLKDSDNDTANQYRPIVIFTSNSEKALPDPFLRRCVFHHLSFPPFKPASTTADAAQQPADAAPDAAVTVQYIVFSRLSSRYADDPGLSGQVADAVDFYHFLRQRADASELSRRPSLAELLNWLDYLMPEYSPRSEWLALAALRSDQQPGRAQLGDAIRNLLLKQPADQGCVDKLLADWRKATR